MLPSLAEAPLARSRSLLLASGIACALLVALFAWLGLFSRTPSTRDEGLAVIEAAQALASSSEPSYALEALADQHRNELNAAPAPELQTGPLQLRGHVVDNFGKALAGASVLVAELGADKPGVVRCLSAADGSFEAHGEWQTEQLVLRVTHADCWNAVHKTVSRGLDGLEVRLERYATIEGVLATKDGGALPDVELTLTNTDTSLRTGASIAFRSRPQELLRHESDQVQCSANGAFTIRLLRPGRYALRVTAEGGIGGLALVREIQIAPGECWSGSECNPLLLELRTRDALEVRIEVEDFPPLAAGNSVRVHFQPEIEVVGRHLEYTSVLLDEHGRSVVKLPAAGRYQLLWSLETEDPEMDRPRVRPLMPAEPQFVEIEGSHARLELDANQRKELARRP